jgi:hypothetical protein
MVSLFKLPKWSGACSIECVGSPFGYIVNVLQWLSSLTRGLTGACTLVALPANYDLALDFKFTFSHTSINMPYSHNHAGLTRLDHPCLGYSF